MRLLPDELKTRLPPLYSQEAEENPFVYARLVLGGTSLNWYVLEGGATEQHGYVLSCCFTGPDEYSFGHFPEWFLQEFRGPNGEEIQQDESFKEGKLTDVVPAPDS
jgi:hypothetical protein